MARSAAAPKKRGRRRVQNNRAPRKPRLFKENLDVSIVSAARARGIPQRTPGQMIADLGYNRSDAMTLFDRIARQNAFKQNFPKGPSYMFAVARTAKYFYEVYLDQYVKRCQELSRKKWIIKS